jgi:nicotinamidase-related amidase
MVFPDKEDSLLLLVDFQKGFLKPFKDNIKVFLENNIILTIELAKYYNLPIVVMEQNNEKLGRTTGKVQNSLGEFYKPNNKFIFSGFRDENIRAIIEDSQKGNIIIVGIETHICVLQTTVDLINSGYNVTILSDAVGSRFKKDWEAGIYKLRDVGANVLTVEMLLFGYLERSDTKDFKHFLKFLK